MGLRRHFHNQLNNQQHRSHRMLSRLVGQHRIPRQLWDFHRHSLRGGLCLGVFIGFTPTIPFHMIIAAVAAVFLRVNLPIALLACWVSNPVTAVPIYWYGDKLGQAILLRIPIVQNWVTILPADGTFDKIFSHSLTLTVGCVLMATIAASLAWLFSGLITRMLGIVHHKPAEHPGPPSSPDTTGSRTSVPACVKGYSGQGRNPDGPEGSNPNNPG
jgi:uncharacterized protein